MLWVGVKDARGRQVDLRHLPLYPGRSAGKVIDKMEADMGNGDKTPTWPWILHARLNRCLGLYHHHGFGEKGPGIWKRWWDWFYRSGRNG